MTYAQFKEIWDKAWGTNPPTRIDATPETLKALIAASDGDMSYFDDIDAKLEKFDKDYEKN